MFSPCKVANPYVKLRHTAMFICLFLIVLSVFTRALTAQVASRHAPDEFHPIQTRSGALSFDVASIRPISPSAPEPVETTVTPHGRVVLHKQSLKSLLCIAYSLGFWQISDKDTHLTDFYDVEANAPEPPPSHPYDIGKVNGIFDDERLREMLQSLLVERFQLKFHREMKTSPIYSLEQNGKTMRLKSVESDPSSVKTYADSGIIGVSSTSGWFLHGASMPELATYLSFIVHKPVLDQTELSGKFNFTSKTTLSEDDFHSPNLRQTLLPVLGEMGLKLESTTGPSEIFVLDSVQDPSAN